jgi:hypothetical protein
LSSLIGEAHGIRGRAAFWGAADATSIFFGHLKVAKQKGKVWGIL